MQCGWINSQVFADDPITSPATSPTVTLPPATPTPTQPPANQNPGNSTPSEPKQAPAVQPYVCRDEKLPVAPKIDSAVYVGKGSVQLTWKRIEGATGYAVTYGPASNKKQYGAMSIPGQTTVYTINSLPAGTYYFTLLAVRNCAPSDVSAEVSARVPVIATNGQEVVFYNVQIGSTAKAKTTTTATSAASTNSTYAETVKAQLKKAEEIALLTQAGYSATASSQTSTQSASVVTQLFNFVSSFFSKS